MRSSTGFQNETNEYNNKPYTSFAVFSKQSKVLHNLKQKKKKHSDKQTNKRIKQLMAKQKPCCKMN